MKYIKQASKPKRCSALKASQFTIAMKGQVGMESNAWDILQKTLALSLLSNAGQLDVRKQPDSFFVNISLNAQSLCSWPYSTVFV